MIRRYVRLGFGSRGVLLEVSPGGFQETVGESGVEGYFIGCSDHFVAPCCQVDLKDAGWLVKRACVAGEDRVKIGLRDGY